MLNAVEEYPGQMRELKERAETLERENARLVAERNGYRAFVETVADECACGAVEHVCLERKGEGEQ